MSLELSFKETINVGFLMHLKLRNQSQIHIQTVINKTRGSHKPKSVIDTHTEKKGNPT